MTLGDLEIGPAFSADLNTYACIPFDQQRSNSAWVKRVYRRSPHPQPRHIH